MNRFAERLSYFPCEVGNISERDRAMSPGKRLTESEESLETVLLASKLGRTHGDRFVRKERKHWLALTDGVHVLEFCERQPCRWINAAAGQKWQHGR